MRTTRSIDAHQHFWRYDPASTAGSTTRWRRCGATSCRADCSRRCARRASMRAIAVQARQTLEETRWLLELADAHPFIAGVVGWVDLQAADRRAQLEAFARHPRLVGVRHIVQAEADGFLARPAFRRGVARLERYGLAYDILVYARQLPAAVDFARGVPEQRFVLDHLASRTSAAARSTRGGGISAARRAAATYAASCRAW